MQEIKPINRINLNNKVSVFLAGSIEQGKAENWQDRVVRELTDWNVILLNPRRDDWDSSWEEKIENTQFNNQVTWELEHIEASTFMVIYFDPKTKSPITLLELGISAKIKPDKLIVCCPEGFWRKGNVDII